jgi:hypothetical protein
MNVIALLIVASPVTYGIQGEGEFRFDSGGELAYARSAAFTVRDGFVTDSAGRRLAPPISVTGSPSITVSPDGVVRADGAEAGQIILAVGQPSGRPKLAYPGDPGVGVIVRLKQEAASTAAAQPSAIPNRLPAPAKGSAVVKVQESCDIATSTITIGQIASIGARDELASRIAAVPIGPAPKVGTDRVVTAVTIQSALRNAGIALEGIEIQAAPISRVRRASRTLLPAEIDAFAEGWIAENLPTAGAVHRSSSLGETLIPTGELTFSVTSQKDTGRALILSLQARVGSETVLLQQAVFTKGANPAESHPILQKPTVKVGDTVRVAVESSGVSVEVTGKVKAISGSRVTVFIEETKATLVGEMRADGAIEVKL